MLACKFLYIIIIILYLYLYYLIITAADDWVKVIARNAPLREQETHRFASKKRTASRALQLWVTLFVPGTVTGHVSESRTRVTYPIYVSESISIALCIYIVYIIFVDFIFVIVCIHTCMHICSPAEDGGAEGEQARAEEVHARTHTHTHTTHACTHARTHARTRTRTRTRTHRFAATACEYARAHTRGCVRSQRRQRRIPRLKRRGRAPTFGATKWRSLQCHAVND